MYAIRSYYVELTNLHNPTGKVKKQIKGMNLLKGLPEMIEISELDVKEAIYDCAIGIIEAIRSVLVV